MPGYEIPVVLDISHRGARPLGGVFYHNAMDVVAMAALLSQITNAETPYAGHGNTELDSSRSRNF